MPSCIRRIGESKGPTSVIRRVTKRARKAVSYNEKDMASKFDIDGKKSGGKHSKASTKKAVTKSDSYKSAPVAKVLKILAKIPKRSKTGVLVFEDHKEFTPNMTPKEVLQAGSFGGTYFRPIYSSVTGQHYKGQHQEFPEDWFQGLNIKRQVTRSAYDKTANKYGVKCGGDLDMWESSGWISAIDPYGWFQWYCRFYLGRRSTDDERQIKRGMGVMGSKGRFRNQLIGRCSRAGRAFDDIAISPVIRQALQHWGYTVTQADADKYVKRKGLPTLPRSKQK